MKTAFLAIAGTFLAASLAAAGPEESRLTYEDILVFGPEGVIQNTLRSPDEPVRHSNVRGTVSYARGGPNTRAVQLYVNLVDNVRLDTLNAFGFPPIAEVMVGMEVVDSLYSGYGGTRQERLPGPSQDSIRVAGNGYLDRAFPKLDLIQASRVIREWR